MDEANFGLGKPIIAFMRNVFAAHAKVDEVVLYGSREKGNYKVGSDIDLTMKGNAVDFSM